MADSKQIASRLGFAPGTSLERLIALAYDTSPSEPAEAFAPLLSLPWLKEGLVASTMEPERSRAIGVLPVAHVGSGTNWAGFYRKTAKAPLEGAPVVVHNFRTCECRDDMEVALREDYGHRSSDGLDDPEGILKHQVVAKDLADYLSLVVTAGTGDLCAHMDNAWYLESARRHYEEGASAQAAVKARDKLLSLPGVAVSSDPVVLLRAAPKIQLKMPPPPVDPRIARKGELMAKKAFEQFFEPRFKGPTGSILKFLKVTITPGEARAGLELKTSAGFMTDKSPDKVVTTIALAREAVRAWNAGEPTLKFTYFVVDHLSAEPSYDV